MNKNDILDKFMEITHQPFLFFAREIDEKPDNTFKTLKFLTQEDNVTAGMIAEYLDIKPSSVTQIIKKLEDAGTIKRLKSEQDARVTFVVLTDKGRESINAQGNISVSLKKAMFDGFTDEELNTLDNYLDRIDANISSEEFMEKLESIFSDDKRWEHFGKMSAKFGRAREQMLERGGFTGFGDFNHRGDFGGFEGFMRGHRK